MKSAIDAINNDVEPQAFEDCFPVILTDNSSGFKDPKSIEYDKDLNQKARIEKNYEYIRYILPKGKPFDLLTQEKVTLMINHINSTARASKNGNTPFKLAQLLLNGLSLESLSLVEIPPDKVHLKPALLK